MRTVLRFMTLFLNGYGEPLCVALNVTVSRTFSTAVVTIACVYIDEMTIEKLALKQRLSIKSS